MNKSNKMDWGCKETPEGQTEEAREERPGSTCTQLEGTVGKKKDE